MRAIVRPRLRTAIAAALCMPACAGALEPLSDAALARVRAGDGMSFNLSGFAMSGNATLRYTTAAGDASLSIGNLAIARSDNVDAPFADPYLLDVVGGGTGRADVVTLARPLNVGGKELWQIAYDFAVNANGRNVSGGSVVISDLAYYGGGLQWTTPRDNDGVAWGYALRSDIGSVRLQPNGRAAETPALVLANIRIAAAGADGLPAPDTPWRIAAVGTQPGILNVRTDAAGQSSLHFGINWPDAGTSAATGAISIGNISFQSAAGNVDLGSAHIGGMQIQYLDVKFHQ